MRILVVMIVFAIGCGDTRKPKSEPPAPVVGITSKAVEASLPDFRFIDSGNDRLAKRDGISVKIFVKDGIASQVMLMIKDSDLESHLEEFNGVYEDINDLIFKGREELRQKSTLYCTGAVIHAIDGKSAEVTIDNTTIRSSASDGNVFLEFEPK